MKIRFVGNTGYIGSDYEYEVEVDDSMTPQDLEEMAAEIFWEETGSCYGWEYVD